MAIEEIENTTDNVVEDTPMSPEVLTEGNMNVDLSNALLEQEQDNNDVDNALLRFDDMQNWGYGEDPYAEPDEGFTNAAFHIPTSRFSKAKKRVRAQLDKANKSLPEFIIEKEIQDAQILQNEKTFGALGEADPSSKIIELKQLEQDLERAKIVLEQAKADAKGFTNNGNRQAIKKAQEEYDKLVLRVRDSKSFIDELTDDGLYKQYLNKSHEELPDASFDAGQPVSGMNPNTAVDDAADEVTNAFNTIVDDLDVSDGALSDFTVKTRNAAGEEVEVIPYDVWDYIEAVSRGDSFKVIANSQKRGTMPDDQVKELAHSLGMNPKKLKETILKTNKGELWNVETLTAARAVLVDETRKLKKLASLASAENASGELKHAFAMQLQMVNLIQSRIKGVQSEAGRLLRGTQIPVEGTQTPALLDQAITDSLNLLGGSKSVGDIAKALDQTIGVDDALFLAREKKLWTKGFDAANESRMNFLLSSPVTQGKNLASAWGLMTEEYQYLKRTAAKEIKKAKKDPTYIPKISEEEAAAYYMGIIDSLGEAMRAAKISYETGTQIMPGQKWGSAVQRDQSFSAEGFGLDADHWLSGFADTMGRILTLDRIPGKALGAGDQFNKQLAYKGKLYQLAVAETKKIDVKITDTNVEEVLAHYLANPTDEMIEAATLHAREVTLTDQLTKTGDVLMRVSNNRFSNLFVPFARIPIRATEWTASRIPGLQRFGRKYNEAKAKGGADWERMKTQTNVTTGVATYFAAMGALGVCTGPEPINAKDRALNQARNIQAMSCKVPGSDNWISYQGIEPFSTAIGLFVGLGEMAADPNLDQETYQEVFFGAVQLTLNLFTEMTMLQGIVELVDALTGKYGVGYQYEKTLQNLKNQFVPNVLKNVSNLADKTRKLQSDYDDFRDLLPDYKRYSPYFNQTNARPIDAFGNTIEKADAYGTFKVLEEKTFILPNGKDALEQLSLMQGVSFPSKWPKFFYTDDSFQIDIGNSKIYEQIQMDAGKIFKEYFSEYMIDVYPEYLSQYKFHNKNFPFGDTKLNERITEIAGSSFTGGKPTDTQAQKKAVRDKVNGEISALHRGAYKEACYNLRDNHPELYEEIEEDIDAFHNSTDAVEDETDINLRSQKFNIK